MYHLGIMLFLRAGKASQRILWSSRFLLALRKAHFKNQHGTQAISKQPAIFRVKNKVKVLKFRSREEVCAWQGKAEGAQGFCRAGRERRGSLWEMDGSISNKRLDMFHFHFTVNGS